MTSRSTVVAFFVALFVALTSFAHAEIAAPPRSPSPVSESLLEPLVHRITELRDALIDQPATRTADRFAAFEAVVSQLEDQLRAGGPAWALAFAVKARLFLACIDRARASQHLASGQRWLDALCPEQEPMVFRQIGGVWVITRGDSARQEIALTFDGGPSKDTAALLDYLKAEGIHATWFLLGCFSVQDPATCRRIPLEGHVVANHTMTHARWRGLAKISEQQGDQEIEEGAKVIAEATGVKRIDLFRPPYGSGAENERVNRTISKHHRYSIMWTVDSLDSMGAGLEKQIRRVLTSTKLNGAIVLMHDHSKSIVTLVKTIVPELKHRGFRFVTVPELIAAGEERLRGERFAELCVAVQQGKIGAAWQGARRAAGHGRTDRLTLELNDLASVLQRLYPAEVAAAQVSPPPAPLAARPPAHR